VLAVFLVLAFVALSHQLTNNTFEGVWTDTSSAGYGGQFYICVDQNYRATGLYSEKGITVGYVDGNKYTGSFFEGYNNLGCYSGFFELYLDPSGTKWNGTYSCSLDANQSTPYPYFWEETRINYTTPTSLECAVVAESNTYTINGFYMGANEGSSNVDICTYYDNTYRASLSDGSFDFGYTALEGRIAGGVRSSPNKDGELPGSSLYYIDELGNLHSIWWAGLIGNLYFSESLENINNTKIHRYDTYVRSSGTSGAKCNQNSEIILESVEYYPLYHYLFEFNSASYITVPILLICSLVVLF